MKTKEERLLELLQEFKNEHGTIVLDGIDFDTNLVIINCKANYMNVSSNKANYMDVRSNKANNMYVYFNIVANNMYVDSNVANNMYVRFNEVTNNMDVTSNEAKKYLIENNKIIKQRYTMQDLFEKLGEFELVEEK